MHVLKSFQIHFPVSALHVFTMGLVGVTLLGTTLIITVFVERVPQDSIVKVVSVHCETIGTISLVTGQNFKDIFRKYVRLTCSLSVNHSACLSVCLYFCLSVCLERDTGRSYWPIVTKLRPYMKLCKVCLGQRWNNKSRWLLWGPPA